MKNNKIKSKLLPWVVVVAGLVLVGGVYAYNKSTEDNEMYATVYEMGYSKCAIQNATNKEVQLDCKCFAEFATPKVLEVFKSGKEFTAMDGDRFAKDNLPQIIRCMK